MLKEALFGNGDVDENKSVGREVVDDACIVLGAIGCLVTYGQNREKINGWVRNRVGIKADENSSKDAKDFFVNFDKPNE